METSGLAAGVEVAVPVADGVKVAVGVGVTVAVNVRVGVGDIPGVGVDVKVIVGPRVMVGDGAVYPYAVEALTGAVAQTDWPAWLASLPPQQTADPSVVSPHVCENPSNSFWRVRPGKVKRSGAKVFVTVAAPFADCCAVPLEPQHRASPEVVMPQLCDAPATRVDHAIAPLVATGAARVVVVASPSWPYVFRPQQYPTLVVVVMPHVCAFPAVRDAKVRPFETVVGTVRWVDVLSPSLPLLPSPQHQAAPPLAIPHAWFPLRAAVRAVHVFPPETVPGALWFVVVPSPSWPFPF
jgi:hypothetical protein